MWKLGAAGLMVWWTMAGVAGGQVTGQGAIRGRVTDANDQPLSGVTVTVFDAMGVVTSATTDDRGMFRLGALSPGVQTLRAARAGLATFVRDGVSVRAGVTATFDVRMAAEANRLPTSPPAADPITDPEAPALQTSIDGEWWREMPMSGSVASMLSMVPGTLASLARHGVTGDAVQVLVDGVDLSSARLPGLSHVRIGSEAVADIQVRTAAVDASVPLTEGAVLNVATRSPSERWFGAFVASLSPSGWTTSTGAPGFSVPPRTGEIEVAVGGATGRRGPWVFGSGWWMQSRAEVDSRTPATLHAILDALALSVPGERASAGQALFAKLTGRRGERHQLSAFYQRDRSSEERTSGFLVSPVPRVLSGGNAVGGRWSAAWSSRWTTTASVSLNDKTSGTEADPAAAAPLEVYRGLSGPHPSRPIWQGVGLVAVINPITEYLRSYPTRKLTITADATWFRPSRIGSHEVQFGAYLQPWLVIQTRTAPLASGRGAERAVLANPDDPSAGIRVFARETPTADTLLQDVHGHDHAIYVQDTWRPSARLTVRAGVRVDAIGEHDHLTGAVLRDTWAIGPRLGAAVRPTPNDVILASWGRVHDVPAAGRWVPSISRTASSHWEYDGNLDGSFESGETTAGGTVIWKETPDPSRRQPFVDEWMLGYRRRLGGRISVEADLVRRDYRAAPAAVPAERVLVGNVFVGYAVPEDWRVSLTDNTWSFTRVTDFSVRVTRQVSTLHFLAGYTRSWRHLEGTWMPGDPAAIVQPEVFPNDRGLADPRATATENLSSSSTSTADMWADHSGRLALWWLAPRGVSVAASYSVQSGAWSGPSIVRLSAPDPRFGPPTVVGQDGRVVTNPYATTLRFAGPTRSSGQTQLDTLQNLSLRVAYRWQLRRVLLEPRLDLSNPFDWQTTTSFPTTTHIVLPGGASQQYVDNAVWRQRGRTWQVSLRLTFR